ncbi:class F sortase [Nakamurella deserti]|uniref:class F sortase n=1 Tax=Nakamurella deserti TaxID=2164074 RepID=UPI000DBE804F|nr:class F sortase [Nakamurella deserti]
MIARQTPSPPRSRRVPALAAAVLALVGVVLIVVAACTSRPAPPQPTAAAAGSISPVTTSTASSTRSSGTSPTPTATSEVPSPTSAEPTPTEPPPVTTSAVPAPAPAPASSSSSPKPVPPSTTAAPGETLLMPEATPVSFDIPRIGASSDLLQLGLNADGTAETPPIDEKVSHAGWLDQSPEPGTLGPAILLGHIDSAKYGPAVFYDIGSLVPGDTVEVTRSDGTVAIFAVDGVREYEKAQFPTLQVYGNLDHAGLRLITCGGVFNGDTGHYESNIVVFASLVATRAA